VIWDILQMY